MIRTATEGDVEEVVRLVKLGVATAAKDERDSTALRN